MADAQLKFEEREARLKEVRESLMAQTKKKGFMTPERKKALKNMLKNIAIEKVKKELEKKAIERQRIIDERRGTPKPLPNDEAGLIAICKEYHNRIYKLNEDKWELELSTSLNEFEINDLKEHVNDQRGRFVVPPLKKVSKYQTQLEKMRQWTYKLAKMDMRGALKPVKKEIELDDKMVSKKENKPEWAASNKPTTPTSLVPGKSIRSIDRTEEAAEENNEEQDEKDRVVDEDDDDDDETEDDVEMDEEVEEIELRMNT